MNKPQQKVIPTPELLTEMEQLEILGGATAEPQGTNIIICVNADCGAVCKCRPEETNLADCPKP